MIAHLFSPLAAKILLPLVGALVIVLGFQRCTIDRQQKRITDLTVKIERVGGVLDQANANHRLTKSRYATAQRIAGKRHAANLARIARERDAINQRTRHALETSRRVAAAGLARLRDQARTHAESVAGQPELAAHADATCRAYAGTSCHQIPALLGAAQDNTDQLVAFQAWARENLAVPLAAPGGD